MSAVDVGWAPPSVEAIAVARAWNVPRKIEPLTGLPVVASVSAKLTWALRAVGEAKLGTGSVSSLVLDDEPRPSPREAKASATAL